MLYFTSKFYGRTKHNCSFTIIVVTNKWSYFGNKKIVMSKGNLMSDKQRKSELRIMVNYWSKLYCW